MFFERKSVHMKSKYTLTIDGIRICVSSDESAEQAEEIANVLNRRIRAIHASSPTCSKTEAALVCALDCLSEAREWKAKCEAAESELSSIRRTLDILQNRN